MYVIRKRFSFSAAHHLLGLPPEHPCSNQHGHNYEVEVVFRATNTNEHCFVIDYRELEAFKEYLNTTCDHKDLNEVFKGMQTSAENLAYEFWVWCDTNWPRRGNGVEVCAVSVAETPKTLATYAPFNYAI